MVLPTQLTNNTIAEIVMAPNHWKRVFTVRSLLLGGAVEHDFDLMREGS
jgi:hypothetical protein